MDGAHAVGLGEPLEANMQIVIELRLWRALAAGMVGGALSLSGMLLQGLFRNSLAAPSVIGVTAGASLGTAIAIRGGGLTAPAIHDCDVKSLDEIMAALRDLTGRTGIPIMAPRSAWSARPRSRCRCRPSRCSSGARASRAP